MGRVVVVGTVVVVALILVSAAGLVSASPSWMVRRGTIEHALTLADGAHVYLDAEVVDKINAKQRPDYFTIHECFSARDRIIVLARPSLQLRLGMNVDIEADLTTLPNGRRALANATVYGYTDKDGRLLRHGPLIKGLLGPTPWQWKVDLTVESREAPAPIPPYSNEPNTSSPRGPTYYPRINDALGRIRILADGDFIDLAAFECKPILSTGVDQTYGNYFIMGEDSGPGTLKVYYQSAVSADDRVVKISGQLREENAGQVLCVNSGPGYDPQVYEGTLMTVSPGKIMFAQTLPDGASASLPGKIVTSNQADTPGQLYIEETGRYAGIRVIYTGTVSPDKGMTVDVTGTVNTGSDGEREILAGEDGVTLPAQPEVIPWPRALGMTNRTLTAPYGPIHTGSLVRCWGKVTWVDSGNTFFYIDDGTGANDGTSHTGVRVIWPWTSVTPPSLNWFVAVTGNSGTQILGANTIRVLRPRSLSNPKDVSVYIPSDTTNPTVSITTPAGTDLHLASGAPSVVISGTASDPETGVASVQVRIGATGVWNLASYSSVTHVWMYTWQTPASATVYVHATDFAGRTADCQRAITVYTPNVIYVDGNRPNDSGNGQTWAAAKKTVVAGITAASAMQPKGEVWVAAGSPYVEHIGIASGIGLFGGFVGGATTGEVYREQRNWRTHATVLDGSSAVYGYDSASVITISDSAASGAIIDGFTIQNGRGYSYYGGGIYCSSASSVTIANNIIRANRAYYNPGTGAYGYGGGLYASGATLTLAGNVFADNTAQTCGGGVYYTNAGGQIVNNTVLRNTASSNCGGVYLTYSSPSLSNNIIAFNTHGGMYKYNGSPAFHKNDVYGNSNYQYAWTTAYPVGSDIDLPKDLVPVDPGIPHLDRGDWHILWGSPCRDAGKDDVVLPVDLDIDAETRRNGPIDIGADETTECWRYTLTFTPESPTAPIGAAVRVTSYVFDAVANQPAAGYQVDLSVDAGEIISVTRDGTVVTLPGGTKSTYGITGTDGKVEIEVTRQNEGGVHPSGTINECGDQVTKSVGVWFYGPEASDWPMFMHDPRHTGMNPTSDNSSETLTLAWWTEVQTAATSRSSTWLAHNQPGGSTGGFIFEHPYIDSSPVVEGNTVVVGTWTRGTSYSNATGSVNAFNAETGGNPLWTATGSPSMGGVASTPCIYNDNGTNKVYVGTTNGYLYCLNLATGTQLWAQPTSDRSSPAVQSKIIGSPVVHDGIVYIGNEAAKVYAFDATAGTLQQGYPVVLPIEGHLWQQPPTLQTENMTGVSSPAVATVNSTDYLLFGCDDGYIYRITLGTSNPQSTLVGKSLGYCVESSPSVVGNEVYVGVSHYGGNQVYRLSVEPYDILTGSNINFLDTGQECRATLACDAYDWNGFLYAGLDTGSTFHKLIPSTLADAATRLTAAGGVSPYYNYFVGSAALTSGSLVYVGNDNGLFYVLDAVNLQPVVPPFGGYLNQGNICSSPAIAYNVDANHNRWVYVTTRAQPGTQTGVPHGRLLAFKTVR